MKLLIVEDDEFKRRNVSRLIESTFPNVEAYYARSISSSMRQIEKHPDIGAVILDMSLPTYDVGPRESGGRPQGFGGLSVIQHLDALESTAHVFVLTQFLQFEEGDESLNVGDLEALLRSDYPLIFRALIHYGAGSDQWKSDLSVELGKLLGMN